MAKLQLEHTSETSEAHTSLLSFYKSLEEAFGEPRKFCQFATTYKGALEELEVGLLKMSSFIFCLLVKGIMTSASLEAEIARHRKW